MKLGIIGYGAIVREFLPHLMRMEGVETVAVLGQERARDRVEALRSEFGIPEAVYDMDALVSAGVDTVYVAVPNHLHFSYCAQALERGLNVIGEKPLTSNEREFLYLEKLAKDRGLFLFEAVTILHTGSFAALRKWLPLVGEVRAVESSFERFSKRYDAFHRGELLPVFDPEKSGGTLMDINVYNFHLVMGLFGPPRAVRYVPRLERGCDVAGTATLEYPGFQALCSAAKDRDGLCGIEIRGSLGTLRMRGERELMNDVELALADGERRYYAADKTVPKPVPEFTAFTRAIREGNLPYCHELLKESLEVCRAMTQARRSAGIVFPADRTGE